MRHELEISIFDLDLSSRSQYYLPRSCWISLESLGKDKHIGIFEFVLEIMVLSLYDLEVMSKIKQNALQFTTYFYLSWFPNGKGGVASAPPSVRRVCKIPSVRRGLK